VSLLKRLINVRSQRANKFRIDRFPSPKEKLAHLSASRMKFETVPAMRRAGAQSNRQLPID
jgi:hypothetical protein